MRRIEVRNTTKAATIGDRIELADTSWSRLFGLLGRNSLDPGRGLLIRPCSGIHTVGMAFAIDVVALDGQCRVLKTWPRLPPFRIAGLSLKTRLCLELAAGEIGQCNIEVGDQLEVVDHSADARSPVA